MDAWVQFFLRAGIPDGVANRYAKTFHSNRITREMLPDLDKSTLIDLGVVTVGDQLAILRRSKDVGRTLSVQQGPKSRISGPGEVSSTASEARRGRPPPDSHEIYHIKMPDGNTLRSQKILKKAEMMRRKGVAVRGTTGVRRAGRSVSPIDKTSAAARLRRDPEVSSSSDRLVQRLGVRGLHSDALPPGKIHQIGRLNRGNLIRKAGAKPTSGLISRALNATADEPQGFRLTIGSVKSRTTLPQVSVDRRTGNRVLVTNQQTVRRVASLAPGRSNRVVDDEEEEEYMEDDEYDVQEQYEEDYEDQMEEDVEEEEDEEVDHQPERRVQIVQKRPQRTIEQRVTHVSGGRLQQTTSSGRAVVISEAAPQVSVFNRISRVTYR
ncbi:unnamed protein product [Caenorhabditis auriculariae]|uniref:SAM domain-containing protein n=1 Tax=Caenorhabditis auriculariae TaxID=2777116 RepID=A0A8S1HLS3_9PELO|nr:unnamed protein product [Caenorhabditis auriculariae]